MITWNQLQAKAQERGLWRSLVDSPRLKYMYRKRRLIICTFLQLICQNIKRPCCKFAQINTFQQKFYNLYRYVLQNDKNFTKLYHSTLTFVSLVAPERALFVHINRFNAAFLEQLNVTWQGISFHHKVVYSVADGRSLRQKSIHHKGENTMLS